MWLIVAAFVAGGTPSYHILIAGEAGFVLRWALDGARARLSVPGCQQVFDDFLGGSGRPLADEVAAAGKTPADILAQLYFADGDETDQCRTDEGLALFTTPGSHVVHVCSKRFVRFAAMPVRAEMLLIHELLHTLGLGEGPPTSAYITSVVANRCGG